MMIHIPYILSIDIHMYVFITMCVEKHISKENEEKHKRELTKREERIIME